MTTRARATKAELLSQLLDLHLSQAIKKAKFRDGVMNKFEQLADDIEADFAELDKDADVLNARRLEIKERARVATNAHHASFDRVAAGLNKLEQAAAGMAGRSNSDGQKKTEETAKPGEVSGVTSEASFQPK